MPAHVLAYTPATVYGHPVPQSAGAIIAFAFIALLVIGALSLGRKKAKA
jgi:hypothetical protein